MKKHLRHGWGFAFGLTILLFHHVVEPVDDGWVFLGQVSWVFNYIYWLFISFGMGVEDEIPPFVRICGWLTSFGLLIQFIGLIFTGDGYLSQMDMM